MDRFWSKVNKTGHCWLWTACKNAKGYGRFLLRGKNHYAPRVSWELHRGSIPEGLCVLHKCDVPACVNPDHLFLGTDADNAADKAAKGRCASNKGSSNGRSKLSAEDVLHIHALRSRLGLYQTTLARMFGVSQPVVSAILLGKDWGHVL